MTAAEAASIRDRRLQERGVRGTESERGNVEGQEEGGGHKATEIQH